MSRPLGRSVSFPFCSAGSGRIGGGVVSRPTPAGEPPRGHRDPRTWREQASDRQAQTACAIAVRRPADVALPVTVQITLIGVAESWAGTTDPFRFGRLQPEVSSPWQVPVLLLSRCCQETLGRQPVVGWRVSQWLIRKQKYGADERTRTVDLLITSRSRALPTGVRGRPERLCGARACAAAGFHGSLLMAAHICPRCYTVAVKTRSATAPRERELPPGRMVHVSENS
jgi:hypothetical protein